MHRVEDAPVPPEDVLGVSRPHVWLLSLVWFLVILSLLSWRSGIYYSGGVDTVVVAKGVLAGLAFLIGYGLLRRRDHVHVIGLTTLVIATSYLLVTVLGAWAGGSALASSVLATRVFLVMATVAFLVVAFPAEVLLRSLFNTLTLVGLVLAVTGVGPLAGGGRLAGGILPVHANQLALLFGPPILGSLWSLTHGRARRFELLLVAALVGLTLLTGSRTGLLALILGAAIVVVTAPRMRIGTFIAVILGVPALFYIATLTTLVSGYVAREGKGQGQITTLNSRTIAWRSAFAGGKTFWERWFGGGLDIKTVPVTGTYWNTQVLDSSWVSAYVQAGLVGIILLGLLVLLALYRSATSPSPMWALLLAMTAYVLVRSLLENGLLDSYVMNVLFLVPALMAEARPVVPDRRATRTIRRLSYRTGSDAVVHDVVVSP